MRFVYLFLTVEILKYSSWGLRTLLFVLTIKYLQKTADC
jgi:hypothetical protein